MKEKHSDLDSNLELVIINDAIIEMKPLPAALP